MQNSNQRQLKKIGVLITVIVVLLLGWFVFLRTSQSGKIGVTVEVLPRDSTVKMDGETITAGKVYTTSGKHVFTAEKSGFKTATVTLTVSTTNNYAGLLPQPQSDEANKWSAQDDVWPKREEIAAKRADTAGEETAAQNPLLEYLPYDDISAPFSIDYYFDTNDSTKTYVLIKNSTADGRIRAINWIRDKGIDPADLNIIFDDFQNPLREDY
jgi:hypothetical protein